MVPFSINPSQPCRISCSFIINLDRREANSRDRDCFFPFGLLRYQLEQVPPGSQATYAERGTEPTDFNLSYAYVAVATRSYLNLNRRLSVPRLVYRLAYNGDRARQLPMHPPTASPGPTALPAAHFERTNRRPRKRIPEQRDQKDLKEGGAGSLPGPPVSSLRSLQC
jgi:hypothetical protein